MILAEEVARLRALFEAAGATFVDVDILMRAETLLDLYGEDMRGRAYLTQDPHLGEMVLRPDFTVPVVEQHLQSGAATARYTYAGKVFRKQEMDAARPRETLQVGFEVFDANTPAEADAEVFATVAQALDRYPVRAATGDIGILSAAVAGLNTSDQRKAALLRHLWRPRKFRALLDRFGGRAAPHPTRAALLAAEDPLAGMPDPVGLRSRAEIAARITALRADAQIAPISGEEIDLLDMLLAMKETAPNVLSALRDIAVDLPSMSGAVQTFAARLDALAARSVDVDALEFEGSFGRTSMEYYDGFVFGFSAEPHGIAPPVASGGRYDALARQLGPVGATSPAVGAVIRPEHLIALGGVSC